MGWFDGLKETVKGAANATASAVKSFAEDPKGHITKAANFIKETGKYIAENPGRAATLAAKGMVEGVGSTVGMVGDLGILAYNYGIRHGINAVKGGQNLPASEFRCADWVKDKIYKIPGVSGLKDVSAQNDYERAILYGTQGVTEVAAFVGVSALTFGAGGAALATIRGGSIAARSASAAGWATRMMSPFASTTVFAAEAGGAAWSIKKNYEKDEMQTDTGNELVAGNLDDAQQQYLAEISEENQELLHKYGITESTIAAFIEAGLPVEQAPKETLEALGINFEAKGELEAWNEAKRNATSPLSLKEESQAAFSGENKTSQHTSAVSEPARSGEGGKLSANFTNSSLSGQTEVPDRQVIKTPSPERTFN